VQITCDNAEIKKVVEKKVYHVQLARMPAGSDTG
jgi:hypothetical protein